MEIELRLFDPFEATDEEWKSFHQFRYKRYPEVYPGDPVTADEIVEQTLRFMREENHIETHTVHLKENPEEQIGLVRLSVLKESSPSYKDNSHICNIFTFSLLTPFRGKGIGRQLLSTVLEFAKKHKKSLIIGDASEADGKAFIKKIEAEEALSGLENRLDMTKLDWNMVEEWASEGPVRSPDSQIEFFQDCPEEILEDYCSIYTEVANQAPLEELKEGDWVVTPEIRRQYEQHQKEVNVTWVTAITREPNGDISGLTEVLYRPSKDPLIFQDLTGVSKKYRGSGKGKWLKAIMLLDVRKRFPTVKTVVTGNATSNAPMLSINNRLGFKVHKEAIVAQIETEKLENYLRK